MLHALFAYTGRQVSAEELAERACTIEIERCGKPIGKQDQYIAALGGIRDIRFGPGEEVVAEELGLTPGRAASPCSSRSCCSTRASPAGRTTSSPSRTRTSSATLPQLDLLRDLAGFAVKRLRSGDVDAIGPALRESWEAKRKLASGVSNDAGGRRGHPGARGGRLGREADRGGRRRFPAWCMCPMERQRAVRESLADMRELPIRLERSRLTRRAQRRPRHLGLTT